MWTQFLRLHAHFYYIFNSLRPITAIQSNFDWFYEKRLDFIWLSGYTITCTLAMNILRAIYHIQNETQYDMVKTKVITGDYKNVRRVCKIENVVLRFVRTSNRTWLLSIYHFVVTMSNHCCCVSNLSVWFWMFILFCF